jgi:hypothetical protein
MPNSYFHRSLNVSKLVDTGFNHVPRNMTLARMIRQHKVADSPSLHKFGLREMEERDIPEVMELFERYMKRFDMSPMMTKEEIEHQFLSGRGKGDLIDMAREGQVVWSYVVEVIALQSSMRASLIYENRIRKPITSQTSSHSTHCRPPSLGTVNIVSSKLPTFTTTRPMLPSRMVQITMGSL